MLFLLQVHLQLAKYHEACRFTDNGHYDKAGAFFHLKTAAECNIVTALTALANMYLGMPHDILSDVEAPEHLEDKVKTRIGLDYMERAAQVRN